MAFTYPNTVDLRLDRNGDLNIDAFGEKMIFDQDLLNQEVLRYILDNNINETLFSISNLPENELVDQVRDLFDNIRYRQFFIDNFTSFSINLINKLTLSFQIEFLKNTDDDTFASYVYNFNTLGSEQGYGSEFKNVFINPNNKLIKRINDLPNTIFFSGSNPPTTQYIFTLPTIIKDRDENNLSIKVLSNDDDVSFNSLRNTISTSDTFHKNILEYIPVTDRDTAEISEVNIYKNDLLITEGNDTFLLNGNVLDMKDDFYNNLIKSSFDIEVIYVNDDVYDKSIETKIYPTYSNNFLSKQIYTEVKFNFKSSVSVSNSLNLLISWRT